VRGLVLAYALGAGACSSSFLDNVDAAAPPGSAPRPDGAPFDPDVAVETDGAIGWASVNDLGQDGTTGGGSAAPVMVMTLDDLNLAVGGTDPAVVQIGATVVGEVKVGSNKTILGTPGAILQGHLRISQSVNVIVRNLVVVGNNCTDNPDCQSGADAVTIQGRSHHIWVDHCDISDGSDGNLDVVSASDYVTISWTKFWYRGRAGGHQFSDLLGSDDSDTGDAGHLRVTFHHDWWADGVQERMPRARYGHVHLFNNLYTSSGDSYCVGVGVNVNILTESNVFSGVRRPVDTSDFANGASVAVSYANLYQLGSTPSPQLGTAVFTPPYPYTLQPASDVEVSVRNNAGPQQ
jgi:pectate lyase